MTFLSKTNICGKHDDIYNLAYKIVDYSRKNNFETVEEAVDTIADIADDILTIVEQAKEDGEKMESRLREYREAIEFLGFRREK